MTLIDKELTKNTDYRTIMLNAINMNKERYCMLFNSKDDGGVTFQLLDNEYLRKTYLRIVMWNNNHKTVHYNVSKRIDYKKM